jgi:hypothetical protein
MNSSHSVYFHFQTDGKYTDHNSYGSTQRTQTNVRFEVLSGVLLQIQVSWDVTNGHSINAPVRLQLSTHSNFTSYHQITQMVALSMSDGRIST